MNYEEFIKFRSEQYNNSIGKLTGYNCEKCKNRGDFLFGEDYIQCECLSIRKFKSIAVKSGFAEIMEKCTFETYNAKEDWQKDILSNAKEFVNSDAFGWFIGGQVGSGKSHICTAIVKEFINKFINCKYVVWNDIVTKLKQNIMEDAKQYDKEIEEIKNIPVLYIDDLFKTAPTKADIDKIFQIINYRYNNKQITLISSEKTIEELIEIDEAVASRIVEMAQSKYVFSIGKDLKKNYRLRKIL